MNKYHENKRSAEKKLYFVFCMRTIYFSTKFDELFS